MNTGGSLHRENFKESQDGRAGAVGGSNCRVYGADGKERMSLQNYRILVMELIAEIFRFGSNNQINMDEVFGNNSDLYNQALQLESTDALGAWLKENCMKMQRQVTNERQDTTKSFVTRAVEYVKEHYADQELSIETICSYLNVSAAYFFHCF